MAAPTSAPPPPAALYRPAGQLDLATALEPYAGPWGVRQAAHLWRRAGFGGSPDDVQRATGLGVHAAVDGFIRFGDASALPAQPQLVDDRPNRDQLKMLLAAAPQAGAPPVPDEALKTARQALGRAHVRDLVAMETWFLDRMIASPAPLQEKMTLFMHGHFTSAYQKGIPAQALVNQNNLFRANALGNLRDLTLKVSQDPAMLRYLDNAQNNKAHPNENYARELMELFTLGIGNYTETDVRESARSFTGWGLTRDFTFQNFPVRHDDGTKTFLGRTGNFTGADIVQIIFTQPAAGTWFAKKLLEFFVYSDPEPALIDTVAALIRKNDFNLQPVMSTVLRSNVFYSERAYRALVKSPVEFVVGSYQLFGIRQSDLVALGALRRMGQILFVPPNVKGWDGGAAWLNSQTLLTRENFASGLMAKMGDTTWMQRMMTSMDPAGVSRALTATILQGDVSPASTAHLTAYLDGTGVSALAALSGENADERIRGAAYLTMAMPAYQLA
ncbi:MAG TPA: DUF1800 domain-containing protein [Candidatus Lustribacter sp.]|jgi:uncharacterized protein (DUF1800 family)|nr:DUF1800 domain-containing protein [Candidatus Lustribacter sp.]